jgi:hypothetical protein
LGPRNRFRRIDAVAVDAVRRGRDGRDCCICVRAVRLLNRFPHIEYQKSTNTASSSSDMSFPFDALNR